MASKTSSQPQLTELSLVTVVMPLVNDKSGAEIHSESNCFVRPCVHASDLGVSIRDRNLNVKAKGTFTLEHTMKP